MIARHGDRRIGARRAEDAALHYSRELLIAAALETADGYGHLNMDPDSLLGALKSAADQYRAAEDAA